MTILRERLHLIPPAIIDIVDGMNQSRDDFQKENYAMRLETIIEFCQEALKNRKDTSKKSLKYSDMTLTRAYERKC